MTVLHLAHSAAPPSEPLVLNLAMSERLARMNEATRRLRELNIHAAMVEPIDRRWGCPVITIRRDPNVSLRALLDKAITRSWVERTCFAEFCGCVVTWTES